MEHGGTQPGKARPHLSKRVWAALLAGASALALAIVSGVGNKVVEALWPQPSKQTTNTGATVPTEDRTELRFVRLFDTDGTLLPPFEAAERSTGHCIDGYQSSDPDALRCFTNSSVVLDPCWAHAQTVACPQAPWRSPVWIVDDPAIDNPGPEELGQHPWALELENPADPRQILRCTYMGGATGSLANMRLNWGCATEQPDDEGLTGYAYGDLNKQNDLWTVYYAPMESSEVRETVVKTVWH